MRVKGIRPLIANGGDIVIVHSASGLKVFFTKAQKLIRPSVCLNGHGICSIQRNLFFRLNALDRIVQRHGQARGWDSSLVNGGIAITQHRFCILQSVDIAAVEAVASIRIVFVVGQCAGLKLCLPIAVMRQIFQPGERVAAKAADLQLVADGVQSAGFIGKGIAQFRRSLCAVRAGPCPARAQDNIFLTVAEIVYLTCCAAAGRGGICQLTVRIVAALRPFRHERAGGIHIGQAGAHSRNAGGLIRCQETGGIGVLNLEHGRVDAHAHKAACNTLRALFQRQVAVRVAVGHKQLTVYPAHKTAYGHHACGSGSGKAVLNLRAAARFNSADQSAGIAALQPLLVPVRVGPHMAVAAAEVDLTVLQRQRSVHAPHQRAYRAGSSRFTCHIRAGKPNILQQQHFPGGNRLNEPRIAGDVHRQVINHRVDPRRAAGLRAFELLQITVADRRKAEIAVKRFPLIVRVPGKINVPGLDRLGNILRQLRCLIQILKVPRIAQLRRISVLQIGKQTVGGHRTGALVHQRIVAGHSHGDLQIFARCQSMKAGLLRKAHSPL